MKKLIYLLFLMPSLVFAQTNISKWWKATPSADATIPALTNGMWYYSSDSSHFTFYQNNKYFHPQQAFGSQSANLFYASPNGSSGVPLFRSIAVADIPTLNQNTTGSAATLTTPRTIQGVSFDGSANINPINGTGFVKATGTTLSYDNSTYLTGNQTITLSGDVTGSGTTSISVTVTKINGTSLGGLATGILKNTTSTGVPSIAVAGDFPTLNQNTTGSAATWTTGRTISITGDISYTSPSINGSGNVTAAGTLATVNSNTGTFGSSTQVGQYTVNGKGLITATSNITVTPAVGSITGFGTGVGTWLATPSWTNFSSAITGTSPYLTVANPAFTGTLTTGTLGFSDTDIGASFQKSVNSYFQLDLQNTSNGATASTDFIINNDQSTASTHYLDIGKNSSGFTGTGSLNTAGYSYLTSTTDDLVIGTTTNNSLRFLTNSSTTDAIVLSGTGAYTFNGSSTALHKEIFNLLGTTITDGAGLYLQNSTAAANNAQQRSPLITMEGTAWKSNATAQSQVVKFAFGVLPVQGTTTTTGNLEFYSSVNGSAYSNSLFSISSGGTISATTLNITSLNSATATSSVFNSNAVVSQQNMGNNIGCGIFTLSNPIKSVAANALTGVFYSNHSSTIGVINTINTLVGGSGYVNGSYVNVPATGGTGSGAQFNITVSGGAVTVCTLANSFTLGGNYSVSDVLSASNTNLGGSGSGFSVTVASVDFTGAIQSVVVDNSQITDAKSATIYASVYSNPTYNITSTQVGKIAASWYKGTHTNLGSFGQYNFVYENTGSLGGIGTALPTSTWDVNGSAGFAITSTSSSITLDNTQYTLLVDASGGNKTETLPSAAGATRRVYVIVKKDSSANTVTISTTAGGNKVINTQYYGYIVQSDGSSWYVIGVVTP